MGLKLVNVDIENFRRFHNVNFRVGRKITAISGQNGVGKSNLVSLIASGSGKSRKANFGGNFQPEFYNFFYIDANEDYTHYVLYLTYRDTEKSGQVVKKLTFKDDTATNRGIRIIPRTSPYKQNITYKEAEARAKSEFGVGGAARIPEPTIYLSISRLYPLGEKRDTVTVTPIKKVKRSKVYQTEADIKFREWYNMIIPGSIKIDASLSKIVKRTSARASLHMDMERVPTLAQSVGQDNIGNIVSALVDVYILSKEQDYTGAIICIDEVEVSLHPDTQLKLLGLLKQLADELNIQFVVSTHSLTILKELLKMQKKSSEDYSVVYLKNPSAPMVMQHDSYGLLKADLFGQMTFDEPKPKIYFEDDVGYYVFKLLVGAFRHQYNTLKERGELRGQASESEIGILKEKMGKLEKFCNIENKLIPIAMNLGCEELIQIATKDKNYFSRVIFLLDGDAKYKETKQKPMIRDYLYQKYDSRGFSIRAHDPNICFLPDYFAPESYLYGIIFRLIDKENEHAVFWRTLDENEETALYTATKIRNMFSTLSPDFNNDDLKKVFGNYHTDFSKNSEIWQFIDKSHLLNYYYGDYSTIRELIDFFSDFEKAYNIAHVKTIDNRFG